MIYKKLYTKDSKGKLRFWEVSSNLELNQDGYIPIIIKFGQDGSDKIQTKYRYTKSGKNKGKSNETSIQKQAELDVGYLIQQQLDKSYVENIEDYKEPIRPMLAHKYNDRKHTIKWEDENRYFASRKLNGIRCFIVCEDSRLRYESRTGKPFKRLHHLDSCILVDQLRNATDLTAKVILDGELFHPDIPFEIICSLINSDEYTSVTDPETGKVYKTEDIRFYCYDVASNEEGFKDLSYKDRFIDVEKEYTHFNSFYFVENVSVNSEEDLTNLAQEWINEGYEGLMLRDGNASYSFGKRSVALLKYKLMLDTEFKIIDIYEAENDPEKVVLLLENHFSTDKQYSTFECCLKGKKEDNLIYMNNKKDYIPTHWCTVQYQVLSQYNVPLFPVGLGLRKGSVVKGIFVPEM